MNILSDEQREEIQKDIAYVNWFDGVAGTRDLTSAEIKELVASERRLKKSVPLLLSSEQAQIKEIEYKNMLIKSHKEQLERTQGLLTECQASEQAWREENENLKALELIFYNKSKSLETRLNQAIEVLKQAHITLSPICAELDKNRSSCLCSTCVAVLSINKCLSSLSTEVI